VSVGACGTEVHAIDELQSVDVRGFAIQRSLVDLGELRRPSARLHTRMSGSVPSLWRVD